jgi:hypothetical protein
MTTGDLIYLYGGKDALTGISNTGYDGTHRVIVISPTSLYLPDVNAISGSSAPDIVYYTIYNSKCITIYPTTITSVDITYLCKPVTPKLDYYVTTATNVRTFLAQSQPHTSASTESYPVTDNTPTPPDDYTSETVEMEWLAQDRPSILAMILTKLGVAIDAQGVAELGVATVKNNDK